MKTPDPAVFHQLYGAKKPRAVYYPRDFLDYAVMIVLSALVAGLAYGFGHVMSIVALALCAFTLATFIIRHGIELRVPVILRRPQDALYALVYKLRNLTPLYFIAIGLLLLENVLIAATPNLPHHVEWMRKGALWLFYIHFISITGYRTTILAKHLAKKELVREVLMQTPWKRVITEKTNISLEIVHAYCTGLLTHVILIAPWYLVITHLEFSVIFLPVVCLISAVVHLKWLKAYPAWYYRDHWVGHNSEFEFIFLHGTHHDAIPSGLIAVAGNGFLEGFTRYTVGSPVALYNPLVAFIVFTSDVKADIDLHQYIPGVGPRIPRKVLEVYQHSTHHYGRLEPYSMAAKVDQPGVSLNWKKRFPWLPDEMMNSFKLDEELSGLEWNNPTYQSTLRLYDKYGQKPRETA